MPPATTVAAYNSYGDLTLNRSLMSGNAGPTGPEIDNGIFATVYTDEFNLFGTDGNAGVVGFTPRSSDIVPSPGVTLKKFSVH